VRFTGHDVDVVIFLVFHFYRYLINDKASNVCSSILALCHKLNKYFVRDWDVKKNNYVDSCTLAAPSISIAVSTIRRNDKGGMVGISIGYFPALV
jgi:hypothetical protein